LHGYGSNERDLPSLEPFLPRGLPWASVRAPLEMGYGAAAWFPLADDDWLRLDPIENATIILWDWIDANVAPTAPIVALGFSQGGLMATQLLRTRPERIKDTVVLAGFVLDAPQPADAFLAQNRPAVFWGHGTADAVIPAPMVEVASAWLEAHSTLTERVYPGLAHSINEQEMRDMKAHLTRG
jgi:phospholipase/carboxylesterase